MNYKKLLCCLMGTVLFLECFNGTKTLADNEYGDTLLLEEDDFDSPEEYEEYLAANPSIKRQQYTEVLKPVFSPIPGMTDVTYNHYVSASASLAYTIVGLPLDNVIQKTYIASNYIYVLQRTGANSYLSRCSISGTTATHIDHMILENFGHTQTLEYYTHNENAYFWVGCNANDLYDKKWAKQLGRIKYVANSSVSYTSIYRFSSLSYANENGTSFGTIKRADAALSSDGTTLLLWVQDTTGEIQYSSYDAEELNDILDDLVQAGGQKYISFSNDDVAEACFGSFRQSGDNRVLPNGSCQGVEINDADSIFIIGGNTGETPKMAKLIGSGSSYSNSYLATISNNSFNTQTETEGIQLKGNYIYFGISDHNTGADKIYSIPKSVFN